MQYILYMITIFLGILNIIYYYYITSYSIYYIILLCYQIYYILQVRMNALTTMVAVRSFVSPPPTMTPHAPVPTILIRTSVTRYSNLRLGSTPTIDMYFMTTHTFMSRAIVYSIHRLSSTPTVGTHSITTQLLIQ